MTQKYESRENSQPKNDDSSNSFLLGALVGGLVGAAAAMLFSPKSGKDFRGYINTEAIMEKTGQLRDTVVNKGGELLNKTSAISQNIVQQSSDFLNKAKNTSTPDSETESKTQYIPLGDIGQGEQAPSSLEEQSPADDSDIRKKLEETKKAFDEEENKVKH